MSDTMEDGNTAAERIRDYRESRQVQPTQAQLENFIENHLRKLMEQHAREYWQEPMVEGDELLLANLHRAFTDGNPMLIGMAVKDLVDAYWRPWAEKAADEHDFSGEDNQ